MIIPNVKWKSPKLNKTKIYNIIKNRTKYYIKNKKTNYIKQYYKNTIEK